MEQDTYTGKPDYGTDGNPRIIVASVIVVALIDFLLFLGASLILRILAYLVLALGVFVLYHALWWLPYVRFGKLRHRDALLSLVDWRGDESVLDIGTGRGLLLIGAAKKLRDGKAIGIDIWRKQDMVGNSPEGALLNARLEGVSEKVEVRDEDIRNTSFQSGSFDVVLSNLCLHNISGRSERDKACLEIVRVLKPGGVAVISDGFHTKDYRQVFRKEGMEAEIHKAKFLPKSLWLHAVVARKKRSSD